MQFILISRMCNEGIMEYNKRRLKEWGEIRARNPGATEDHTEMVNGVLLVDRKGKHVAYMSLYGTRPTPSKSTNKPRR